MDESPWNAVTITTAVVAVAGLMLSFYNAWRNWRTDHPKVHWDAIWDRGGDDRDVLSPSIRFFVRNTGIGTATDVVLRYRGKAQHAPAELRTTGGLALWFNTEGESTDPVILYAPSRDWREHVNAVGVIRPGDEVSLEWRQSPATHRLRTKRFPYKSKPS